mmetsp:Transcript_7426/g.12166  ORF Transcript_7426/g.12166 Transcript_7426/m.12166 type:complete len:108 (+) Transcript_7426:549-872(+)
MRNPLLPTFQSYQLWSLRKLSRESRSTAGSPNISNDSTKPSLFGPNPPEYAKATSRVSLKSNKRRQNQTCHRFDFDDAAAPLPQNFECVLAMMDCLPDDANVDEPEK